MATLLPEIEVVKCRFQCDECRAKQGGGEKIVHESRKVRVVNLPLGATEDRPVGTLDIEKALRERLRVP